MIQISNLTNAAKQSTSIAMPDGTILILGLLYCGGTQRWAFSISHPTLTLNGQNLCQSPNILRPFRNNIAFGVSCVAADGVDPVDINDFANQRIALYILDASDVAAIESDVYLAAS